MTPPDLPIDANRQQSVSKTWQFSQQAKNIVLGIGSSEDFKMWPKERFVQLMQKLHDYAHCRFYLLGGGEKERVQADWIEQQSKMLGVDVEHTLTPSISIAEAVHLSSLADLYIGNDTGFLNLTAALAIPAIGIFGASPPLTHSQRIPEAP